MREVLASVLFLGVGVVLVLSPASDYRVGVVGIVMVVGGLTVMAWSAVRGSRRRESKSIPPERAAAPSAGDQR